MTRLQDRSKMTLVAVCTPVFNGEAFLAETMAAVQGQTYPHLVHVISDNASTDTTAAIIASYQGKRVPVLSARTDRTMPMIWNWNRAVELAPAEARWIRVLCADDLIAPEAIEKTLALAETDPAIGLVGCGHVRGELEEDMRWGAGAVVLDGLEASRRYFEYRGSLLGTHLLARRDLLFAERRPFDDALTFADNDMALRLLAGCKFAYHPDPLAITREHDGSMSSDVIARRRLHFFEWLIYLDRYGPKAFGADFSAFRRCYMRHYLRRMQGWPAPVRQEHLALLARRGQQAGFVDQADAWLNWIGKRVGLQRGWQGYPF